MPSIDTTRYIRISGFPPKDLLANLHAALLKAPVNYLDINLVDDLKKRIRNNAKPDYRRDWAAFSYLYFVANFVKTYSATQHLLTPSVPPRKYRILDLGCGAGASSAAVLTALSEWLTRNDCFVELTGVDNSSEQLSMNNAVLSPWLSQFPGIEHSLIL